MSEYVDRLGKLDLLWPDFLAALEHTAINHPMVGKI